VRALVFALLLANLLFYAFAAGLLGYPGNPDAGRGAQQVAADQVHIVGRGDTPPPKGAAAGNGSGKQAEPRAENEEVCLLWDRLAAAEADRLASELTARFAGFRAQRRTVPEAAGWWVYLPPLASRADAEKRAGELKQAEVEDYFIVPDNAPNRLAISLGVFSTEKGGQDRLAELRQKGVKGAKLMPRPGKDSHAVVEVRGPAARKAEVQEAAAVLLPKVTAQVCK
jgi:hypothetical protein